MPVGTYIIHSFSDVSVPVHDPNRGILRRAAILPGFTLESTELALEEPKTPEIKTIWDRLLDGD